jgi:hypothetical protein
MFGAAAIVMHVVGRGDAGIERLHHRQFDRAIHLLRSVRRAELAACGKVGNFAGFADQAAERRRPHVLMCVDQAGKANKAATVDRRAAAAELRPDSDDLAVADVDVGLTKIADRRVHRQHVRAADGELAPRRQAARLRPGTALHERTHQPGAGRRSHRLHEGSALHGIPPTFSSFAKPGFFNNV